MRRMNCELMHPTAEVCQGTFRNTNNFTIRFLLDEIDRLKKNLRNKSGYRLSARTSTRSQSTMTVDDDDEDDDDDEEDEDKMDENGMLSFSESQ